MIRFPRPHPGISIATFLIEMGLIMFTAIFLFSSPSVAKPVVTWTLSSLTEAVLAGGTIMISVSFTASKNLSNVLGMLPSTVVAVKIDGHVREITDVNENHQTDGVFDQIVSNIIPMQ